MSFRFSPHLHLQPRIHSSPIHLSAPQSSNRTGRKFCRTSQNLLVTALRPSIFPLPDSLFRFSLNISSYSLHLTSPSTNSLFTYSSSHINPPIDQPIPFCCTSQFCLLFGLPFQTFPPTYALATTSLSTYSLSYFLSMISSDLTCKLRDSVTRRNFVYCFVGLFVYFTFVDFLLSSQTALLESRIFYISHFFRPVLFCLSSSLLSRSFLFLALF